MVDPEKVVVTSEKETGVSVGVSDTRLHGTSNSSLLATKNGKI